MVVQGRGSGATAGKSRHGRPDIGGGGVGQSSMRAAGMEIPISINPQPGQIARVSKWHSPPPRQAAPPPSGAAAASFPHVGALAQPWHAGRRLLGRPAGRRRARALAVAVATMTMMMAAAFLLSLLLLLLLVPPRTPQTSEAGAGAGSQAPAERLQELLLLLLLRSSPSWPPCGVWI